MWHEPASAKQRLAVAPIPPPQLCSNIDHDSAESVLISLALTLEIRDPQTAGHCQRLSHYASAMGEALHLGETDLETLRRGGVLHDIGKVGIPDAILLKPGPLTATEFQRMKQHTTIGDTLCQGLRSLNHVRQIVRNHHERIDGTGYPDGLKGREISLLAQIVGLVDAFDALTTTRPYKSAQSVEAAYEELIADARRGWRERALVDEFIALGRNGGLHVGAYERRHQ
jgi:putative two-component system response regulator